MQPSGQDRKSGVTVCKPLTRITFPLHANNEIVVYGGEGDGGGGGTGEEAAGPMTTVQECIPRYIFKETIGDHNTCFKPKHDLVQVVYVPKPKQIERKVKV